MAERQRRWLRRLAKGLAVLAATAVVVAAAGKWWIAPAAIRWQIARYLPEYWDGSAEIGGVDFSYTGLVPVAIRGLVLRDRLGRQWLGAETVRFAVPNWPSVRPRLGSLLVAGLKLTAHCAGGRCEPPLKRIPSELWSQYVDLKSLLIRGGRLEVTADGQSLVQSSRGDVLLLSGGDGWVLSVPTRPLVVGDLRAGSVVVEDDRVEIRDVSGRTCGGSLVASAAARLQPGGRIDLRGRVTARGVDLARLRLPLRGAEQGLASGALWFRAGAASPDALSGSGTAFVEGADLRNVPAVAEVLRRAGLGRLEVLSDSDVELRFRLHGTVASLEQGRIHLPLAAVDIEPGATLDLWDGQLDAVAVVVLFEKVRGVLKSIPVVGLVVDVTDRLSRLRVRGQWAKPESIEVTSVPLSEVKEGSRKFLAAAAKGGSRFARALRDRLRGLFESPDANGATTRPGGP